MHNFTKLKCKITSRTFGVYEVTTVIQLIKEEMNVGLNVILKHLSLLRSRQRTRPQLAKFIYATVNVIRYATDNLRLSYIESIR